VESDGAPPARGLRLCGNPLQLHLDRRQSADGAGATVELIDPTGTPSELADKHYVWRGSTEFGVCTRCGHFQGETSSGNMRCGLKKLDLPCADAGKLCVSFTPAAGSCD
jgi:hypothetical protein